MQLSGFKMEVIETAYAGHAKVLSSTVDLKKFPDGNINCVSLFFCFLSFFGNQVPVYFTIQDDIFPCLQVLYVLVAMGSSMRSSLFPSFFLFVKKINWNTVLFYCTWVDISLHLLYINHVC